MRRLPIYILIDTSGSMRGEPMESVKVGLADLIATLRKDPYALETVNISIITYAHEPKQILPPTMLEEFEMPEIANPESGPKHLGAALKFFCQRIEAEVKKDTPKCKGDWKPMLFLFTSGKISDVMDYNHIVPKVKSLNLQKVVAILPSLKAKTEQIQNLTDLVYNIDSIDMSAWKHFFLYDWIEAEASDLVPTDSFELPGPPEEVNILI